jgi:hypothetical protein
MRTPAFGLIAATPPAFMHGRKFKPALPSFKARSPSKANSPFKALLMN